MPTYRVDVAYDGAGFHGYAKQRDVRTVQGVLEAALARVVGPVETVVAGRTDAGVHARGQVVSFAVEDTLETSRLMRSLNGLMAPEVVVTACRQVADGFSARFSALARSYRYTIVNRPSPDPLRRSTAWHVSDPLDVPAMQRAAEWFVGEHDFGSLCRRAEGRATTRRVLEARWSRRDDTVEFDITASSFCHQMVRSIVALCVEVGRGRVDPAQIPAILEAKDRAAARGVAPPQGLTLWAVDYPAE
jgi:tRNA pseudouridine38-40 synthase